MVQHVYDITYGTVRNNEDTLVVIDDSIVRGTTLKESIIRMLSRLNPKNNCCFICSSNTISRSSMGYSKLGDFIAFRAAIALLKERNMEHILDQVRDQNHCP